MRISILRVGSILDLHPTESPNISFSKASLVRISEPVQFEFSEFPLREIWDLLKAVD
jgi:hypothetical protein